MGENIILQGITLDEFRDMLRQDIRAEILENESKKSNPLTKAEACSKLGISYKTLMKAIDKMQLKEIYPSDLIRIKNACPELFRRSKKEIRI